MGTFYVYLRYLSCNYNNKDDEDDDDDNINKKK